MYPLKEFLQTEAELYDADWFNRACRYVRMYKRPLVDKSLAKTGIDYILGRQDMTFIKNLFINTGALNLTNQNYKKYGGHIYDRYSNVVSAPVARHENHDKFMNAEMSDVYFKPLPIMEKLKNIILADIKKMGVVINVRAEDPTSKIRRDHDRYLIERRNQIEQDLTYIYTSIGEKPYSLPDHEGRFGEKPGNGNIQAFDEMGMDNQDPTDINFMFENFYKLDDEIAVQKLLEVLNTYNKLADKGMMWGMDMMAKKSVAAKNFVNKLTGEVMSDYVSPETAYIFGGTDRMKTFDDALAKGIEQQVTLRQALEIAGDSFDIKSEWTRLMMALSSVNSIEFTGVEKGWAGFVSNNYEMKGPSGGGSATTYSWNDILNMTITMGYVEISGQIEIEKGEGKTDKSGGAYYEDNQPKEGQRYSKKAKYETPVFCASYLALTNYDQILFDFGKVPYQQIEGYNDTRNNFSIITYKETGDPIGILCVPYIDLINECWYKYKYEIRRAKPPGTDYNWENLIAISNSLITDLAVEQGEKIGIVMQILDSSPNGLWTWPIGPDGKPLMMTNNQLNIAKPNGLQEGAMMWWKIIVETQQALMDTLGISPLREGDPGNTKDSVSNQFKALEYSIASTYYIADALTHIYQEVNVRNVLFVQDIIHFKDHDIMAYKWLETLIGAELLTKIETLGKKALHRYGIFIESLNQAPLKAKLDAILANDQNSSKITTGEALIISSIKNPKEAWKMLAYFEQRNAKLAQKAAAAQTKSQQEHEQQIAMIGLNTEKMKMDNLRAIAAMNNFAAIQGKVVTQQGGIQKQAMKHDNENYQMVFQALQELQGAGKDAMSAIQQLQNPQPPTPPQQQQGQPGGVPGRQQGLEQGRLAQLRQQAD